MGYHAEQVPFTFSYQREVDWLGRPLPYNPDYARLPACECSQSFLQWVRATFPTVLDHPTIRSLDEAMLAITLEYAHRLQTLPEHPLNYCLPEVFTEILGILYTKRDELLRQPNAADAAQLFVGVDEKPTEELQ